MSTDLVVQRQADIEALVAQQEEEFAGVESYTTPILKVTQSMTKEVKSGDVDAGEFYNTLTGESLGTNVDFIVSFFQRGRSASSKDSRYYIAIGTDIIPESWSDLVGPEFVGTRFDEYPDAEEQYKRRVNAKEIEWGKGPLVSTTYNYTGLVLPSQVEGDESEAPEPMPVRISFLRTTKSAHDKLITLKKATMRNKAYWDVVFALSTESKAFGRNDAYIVNVKKGRETTTEERNLAIEIAQAVAAGRTQSNDEAAAAGSERAEPDSKGGLAV